MPNWVEEFGATLITKEGPKPTADVLAGKKAVLIYFSAHWCPPCRAFTPELAQAYKNYSSKDVEIVFASCDQDQGSFEGYFGEMPWTAIPFGDKVMAALQTKYGLSGIPMLVVLNGEGALVTKEGRGAISSKKDLGGALSEWGL